MEAIPIWFENGNCRNLGIDALRVMIPDVDDETAVAIGKSVCLGECPVFELCDTWARENRAHDVGIYAAKHEVERSREIRNVRREQSRRGQRST